MAHLEHGEVFVFHQHKVSRDYTIHDKAQALGEGGFGQVFKCTHKGTKAERACKKIDRKSVKIGSVEEKMFEEEVRLQMSLDHPNIVKVFDVYKDSQFYYIVLELCTGGDLFDAIVNKTEDYGEDTVAMMAKQMIAGIVYMHSMMMAHRDLKPENYLLANSKDVEKTPLKLTDFGMSKRFTAGKPMTTEVVTPFYVAPEVNQNILRKDKHGKLVAGHEKFKARYTEKCDIWSLGVIFFVFFTGEPPFQGRTEQATLLLVHDKTKPKYKQEIWGHISKPAQEFVKKCMQRDVNKRPTAAELFADHWLVEHIPKMTKVPLSQEVLGNLRRFNKRDKIQKAALQLVAKYIDESLIQELRDMFQSMDENGDGTLTLKEVQHGLEQVGVCEGADELRAILEGVDVDHSGQIDYGEFLAATMGQKTFAQKDVLWSVFKQFDLHDENAITKDDLIVILTGETIRDYAHAAVESKEEVDEIMAKYDTDRNGKLDFEEFSALVVNRQVQKALTKRKSVKARTLAVGGAGDGLQRTDRRAKTDGPTVGIPAGIVAVFPSDEPMDTNPHVEELDQVPPGGAKCGPCCQM